MCGYGTGLPPCYSTDYGKQYKRAQFIASFFLSRVPLLIHDASHGSLIVHQYLWSSVLRTEAAIVTSSLYIEINVIFFFFPFGNCSFAHFHIRWFCLHFPHFFRLNLHSRLKIEAESHGHWSKISAVKSQLSRRCVSTALRSCICPFCLSGPVSYQQPGEHWQ